MALTLPLPATSASVSAGKERNGASFRAEALAGTRGQRSEHFASLLAGVAVPLHLRYQMPVAGDDDGFATTVLPPPQVYARCRGGTGGEGGIKGVEARPWLAVDMVWEGSQGDAGGAGRHIGATQSDTSDLRARACRALARQRFEAERLLSRGYLCLSVPVGSAWHGPGVAASTLLVSVLAAAALVALAHSTSLRGKGDRAGWADDGWNRNGGSGSSSGGSSGGASQGDVGGACAEDVDSGRLRRRRN